MHSDHPKLCPGCLQPSIEVYNRVDGVLRVATWYCHKCRWAQDVTDPGKHIQVVANSAETMNTAIDMIRREYETHKWLQITVKNGKQATVKQRNWMHPVFRTIAKALSERSGLDYTESWVKTMLKRRWGVVDSRPDPETGEPVAYLVSTEDYTRGEKCHLMDRTIEWAAGLEIVIDPPDEYRKMQDEQTI